MQINLVTNSPEETIEQGRVFIQNCEIILNLKQKSVLVSLEGDLGYGKTQFAKGIALGLGIKDVVNSPSYAYINEYSHDLGMLIHVDAWRVDTIEIERLLNLQQYVKPGNVIILEWGGNLREELVADFNYLVNFTIISDVSRELKITRGD